MRFSCRGSHPGIHSGRWVRRAKHGWKPRLEAWETRGGSEFPCVALVGRAARTAQAGLRLPRARGVSVRESQVDCAGVAPRGTLADGQGGGDASETTWLERTSFCNPPMSLGYGGFGAGYGGNLLGSGYGFAAPMAAPMYQQPIVQEQVMHRAVPVVQEQVVEVPQIQYQERIVEVPQVQVQERIVHVPKVVVQEREVHVPKIEYVEKIVEVPQVQQRPVEQIVHVEVPQIQTQARALSPIGRAASVWVLLAILGVDRCGLCARVPGGGGGVDASRVHFDRDERA